MILRSKKTEIYFTTLLGLILITTLLPMALDISYKTRNKFGYYIGESQLMLLKTYDRGEKALYYIDESAKLAYREALYETLSKGFSGCSNYDGYALWTEKNTECFPDIKTEIADNFMLKFNKYLNNFSEPIPENEYGFYYSYDDTLVGKSLHYLRMDFSNADAYNFAIVDTPFTEFDTSYVNIGSNEFSLVSPVPSGSRVSSPYKAPRNTNNGYHHGVDYAIGIGTQIRAAADGRVIYAADGPTDYPTLNWKEYGKRIIIQHEYKGIKYWTLYGHLKTFGVKPGQVVKQGQVIGLSGNTGASTGPHLHFELRVLTNNWNSAINPECAVNPGKLPTKKCEITNGVYTAFIKKLNAAENTRNEITGAAIFEPDEEDINIVEEKYPPAFTCSEIGGKICGEEEVCSMYAIESLDSYNCCMEGGCIERPENITEDPVLDITELSCNDFEWDLCEEGYVCEGEEYYLEHQGVNCCEGNCLESQDSGEDDEARQQRIYSIFFFIGIIIVVLLIIFFIHKKKTVALSLITAVMFGLLIFAGKLDSPTGFATASIPLRDTQIAKVCQIADAYDIPSSTLLAIAQKESGIQHFKGNKVKISPDGGVGMMQIDPGTPVPSGPFYACGTSDIDGRKLDIKDLKDNIECGAKTLIRKCNLFNCLNTPKQYHCSNSNNPLPEKNVFYEKWDIAIRAYNGWGCEAPGLLHLYPQGIQDPGYVNLLSRIQGYVENFHITEKSFENTCDNVPDDPELSTENTVTGIIEEDKLGYYYLNPSFRLKEDLNLKEIYDEIAFSMTLIQETRACKHDLVSFRSCATQALQNSGKSNWQINNCNGELCSFTVNFGESVELYLGETYQEIPLVMNFALNLNTSAQKTFSEYNYDVTEPEAPGEESFDDFDPGRVSGSVVYGIDVSHWQAAINWQTVKKSGKDFAFIKATQCNNFYDDNFQYNIQQAHKADILAGAYHFADPLNCNPNSAAKHFAAVTKPYLKPGYLRPVLDLERGNEMSTAQLTAWVHSFMNTYKSQTGITPIIYANPSYIHHELDSSINKYDLWIAQWGVSEPKVNRKWSFWQYTDSGRVNGIGGRVDLDVYKGSMKSLRENFEIK